MIYESILHILKREFLSDVANLSIHYIMRLEVRLFIFIHSVLFHYAFSYHYRVTLNTEEGKIREAFVTKKHVIYRMIKHIAYSSRNRHRQ